MYLHEAGVSGTRGRSCFCLERGWGHATKATICSILGTTMNNCTACSVRPANCHKAANRPSSAICMQCSNSASYRVIRLWLVTNISKQFMPHISQELRSPVWNDRQKKHISQTDFLSHIPIFFCRKIGHSTMVRGSHNNTPIFRKSSALRTGRWLVSHWLSSVVTPSEGRELVETTGCGLLRSPSEQPNSQSELKLWAD